MSKSNAQTTTSSKIQLHTIWTLPTFTKILAIGLEELNEESEKELGFYALRICEKSVGLYSSAPPFNASRESMRKYLEQVFHLKNKGKPPTLAVDPSYLPKLKFHLKNAINLPPKTCNQSCNPFIRIRIIDKAAKTKKDCVFTSPKLYKELNPVWNCRGSIPISHEAIASKRKLVIELWDAHIPGACASLRQMVKSRNLDDYIDSWRDLIECMVSKFSSQTRGDKIAYTSLYLKDIPATEYNVSLEIRDALGHDCALLKFSLSWGSEITSEDTEVHVSKLKIHIRLIRHLIFWHCRQIIDESISESGLSRHASHLSAIIDPNAPKNTEDELDDIMEPIVSGLLNSPGFTLISQHCISLNIHLRENEILLHIVACRLLKVFLDRMDRIPKEKEMSISPTSYSYLFRVILLSFILSLQVPQKLKSSNDSVFGIFCYGLEEALESIFHSYGLRFGPIIFDMLQKIDSHPFEGVQHLSKGLRREFLLFLRTFDRYSKIFPKGNFQERFNVFLCKSICDYLEYKLANQPNYVSPALYDNVADTIENFDEILQRNWSCSLSKILGGNGMHRVLTAFAKHINPLVSNLITFWQRDPVKHQETLFDAYLAVMRIDKMFFTIPLMNNSSSQMGPKSRTQPKLDNLIDIEMIAQQSRFSSRASSMYSIDEFARQASKLLPIRQDRPPSVITRIELNSYFQFHKTSKSDAGLTNIFPPNIELMWGNLQRTKIRNFIQKLTTDMIFKRQSDMEGVKIARVTAWIYRGIFSRTFHFFASFNSWSEKSFLLSLSIFLESIQYFADYLGKKTDEMQKTNQPVVDGIDMIILNVLSLLRNRYLRKEFIESLTDAEEYMAWEWFLAVLEMDSSFDTRFPIDEKALLAKAETKRLSTIENFLITLLIKTDLLCHKICCIEDGLMGGLIRNILLCIDDKKDEKKVPSDANPPGVVEKSFDYTLRLTVDSIESMENKKLLLFGLKHNLQKRILAEHGLPKSTEINVQIELDKLQTSRTSSDSGRSDERISGFVTRGKVINEHLLEMTDIFVRQLDIPPSMSSDDSTDS